MRRALLIALLLAGCDGVEAPLDASAPADGGSCDFSLNLPSEAELSIDTGAACAGSLVLAEERIVEVWVSGGSVDLAGVGVDAYLGPMRLTAGEHALRVTSDMAQIHVRDLGAPAGEVDRERSLTWIDATLLDDPSTIGLGRVMQTASSDGHGGRLLDAWFRRFATTAHSERLGPQRMLEEIIAAQGSDPSAWDLDALPLRVTGVHARLDLADGAHCGQLRVSLASTHPVLQPFHLIFLYEHRPLPADLRPDGSAHCAATALRFVRLSELGEPMFLAEARRILDETLSRETLLVAESVSLLISPWEWRQWFLEDNGDPTTRVALPEVFENRPLFQTIDVPRVNTPGPVRERFLRWVEDNAAALDARALLIPEEFRAESARVNDGVPWIPLDLGGVEATAAFPTLRQQLEIVGCPACHAADADFVQTLPDRTFSPFYDKELVARAALLRDVSEGIAVAPPQGPLQTDPVLTP